MVLERWRDPAHPLNGPKYHTGKPCIEPDCDEPAGTAWSPYLCQRHNADRFDRIDKSFEDLALQLERDR